MQNTKDVPYYAQWESADIIGGIVSGKISAMDDPLWEESGAESIAEYVRWASNICGMACLRMVLASRFGRSPAIMDLTRGALKYGAYREEPDGTIKGMIYAPFVEFIRDIYGIKSDVVTGVPVKNLAKVMQTSEFFLASVHHSIRWAERMPPQRGGHLVLVTNVSRTCVTFHNPSGHTMATQQNVSLEHAEFDRFFAGRGIAIFS